MGAERLFYRLIVQCDDFGRMDARLPIIRAKCFPLKIDKVKEKDVKGWLKELSDVGLVKTYIVDDKPFLYFTNWNKHQQKRANHSKYPAPDDGMISDDINCNQLQEDVPENRESRNEKREMIDQFFESIWKLYPRKIGKAQISDKKKKELYLYSYDVIKKCIERYKEDKKEWQEWKHGSTFFNSGLIDYLDENYSPGKDAEKPPKEAYL